MNGKRVVPNMSGQRSDRTGVPQRTPGQGNGRKPKKSRKDRVLRVVIIVVAVLLALVIGVIAVWVNWAKAPDVNDLNQMEDKIGNIEDIGAPVRFGSDRKKDFYTFLVIGRDTGGGGNTDTILLAAYDVANKKMNVLSIPRDTMVNVSWDVKKINSVYNNYGGGDKGIEALGKEMAQLVGFVPDFQVVLEWKAVGELVDALGGVTYDVPRNMYYNDPTQNLHINIKKGKQKLNGTQAMQVVRFRDGPNGYANGDLGRIETQQGFLKAVIEQCLSITNVTRIGELSKVFKDNVKTNLELSDMAFFGQKAVLEGGLSSENIKFHTMPCTSGGVWSRSYGQRLSYVLPKTDELVALINESFNPYKDELQENELDIMHVNSDGTIGSSTGKLEDSKANANLNSGKKSTKSTDTDKKSNSDTEKKTESTGGTTQKPNSGTNSGTSGEKPTAPSTKPEEEPPTTPPVTTPSEGEGNSGTTEETPTPPTPPENPAPPENGDSGTQQPVVPVA